MDKVIDITKDNMSIVMGENNKGAIFLRNPLKGVTIDFKSHEAKVFVAMTEIDKFLGNAMPVKELASYLSPKNWSVYLFAPQAINKATNLSDPKLLARLPLFLNAQNVTFESLMDVDREHGYLFAKFEGDNKPKDKIDQSGDLALTIEQNLGILSALKREHVVYADKINIIPLPDSGSNTSNTGDASSANESSNASSKPETAPATPLTSTSPTSESTTDIATDTGAGAATGAASTHSVSSGSSSTSNPVLVHDNAIANQMLFAQLNFLPTLINHGVGFWSTVDSINTEYQQVKYQGEQISLGYAKAVKLGNTTYILGVGFHINTIKNKASHFDVTTQQYAVSLYDTLQFNHGFFIDVSGFVGQTHGRTQFVIGPFAFNNRFKTTNIGMALQLGKVFELSDRFQLTPKLGLIYEHLGRYDFVNDAGIRYEGSASNVTLANASLRLDWQATPALKPFGAIEYTHALKSSMLVRVSQNTTEFSAQSQAPKDITKLALGIKWQIKPTLAAQFNLNTAFGPERRKTYGLGASIAWRF